MIDKNYTLYYGLVFSLLLQLGWLTSCSKKQSFSFSKVRVGVKVPVSKRKIVVKKKNKPKFEYHFIKVQKAFPLHKGEFGSWDGELYKISLFYRVWTTKSNIYEMVPSNRWDAHRMFGRLVVGKRFKVKILEKQGRSYPLIIEITEGPLPDKGQITH